MQDELIQMLPTDLLRMVWEYAKGQRLGFTHHFGTRTRDGAVFSFKDHTLFGVIGEQCFTLSLGDMNEYNPEWSVSEYYITEDNTFYLKPGRLLTPEGLFTILSSDVFQPGYNYLASTDIPISEAQTHIGLFHLLGYLEKSYPIKIGNKAVITHCDPYILVSYLRHGYPVLYTKTGEEVARIRPALGHWLGNCCFDGKRIHMLNVKRRTKQVNVLVINLQGETQEVIDIPPLDVPANPKWIRVDGSTYYISYNNGTLCQYLA